MRSNFSITMCALSLACAADEVATDSNHLETHGGLYQLQLNAAPDPPKAGEEASLVIEVMAAGEPVEGATVTMEPWMVHHGHGVDEDPMVIEIDPGVYEGTWIYSMSGYWEITIDITGDDGHDHAVVGYEVQ